jgi:hypothetical protein
VQSRAFIGNKLSSCLLLLQMPKDVVTAWGGGAMLRTHLNRSDFSPRGELRLKCVASVMGLYNISSGSIAIWLEQGEPPGRGDEGKTSTGVLFF